MTANVEELGKITASKEILNDIAIAYGASRDYSVHTFGLGTLRKDRQIWKTGFITELLFTSLAVVMTDVSPMRMKETDLQTA